MNSGLVLLDCLANSSRGMRIPTISPSSTITGSRRLYSNVGPLSLMENIVSLVELCSLKVPCCWLKSVSSDGLYVDSCGMFHWSSSSRSKSPSCSTHSDQRVTLLRQVKHTNGKIHWTKSRSCLSSSGRTVRFPDTLISSKNPEVHRWSWLLATTAQERRVLLLVLTFLLSLIHLFKVVFNNASWECHFTVLLYVKWLILNEHFRKT